MRRHFRFRIWGLLLVVAVAAALIGGENMRRRRTHYLQKARAYAALETQALAIVSTGETDLAACEKAVADSRKLAESAATRNQVVAKWMLENEKWVREIAPRTPEIETRLQEMASMAAETRDIANRTLENVKRAQKVALTTRTQSEIARKWASYFTALRKKYEHAARRPWLSVAPDAPNP